MFHDGGLYMKISKKILSLMLCLIMCIMTMATGSVYSFAEDGDYEESEIEHTVEIGDNTLVYTIENGEITIVGCDREGYGFLEIPGEIDGYPVTTIGNGAFAWCLNISIKVPESVKKIKYGAFNDVSNVEYNGDAYGSPWGARAINGYIEDGMVYTDNTKECLVGCSHAKTGELIIPEGVNSIECDAIYDIPGIIKVVIPSSVTSFNWNNFYSCSKVQTIEVDKKNECLTSVDGVLFSKDKTDLITYPEGKKGASYKISDGVERIGHMSSNKYISEVVIPNSVTEIFDGFYSCENLKKISVGENINSIGGSAFANTAYFNDEKNWTDDGLLYIDNYLISASYYTKKSIEIREGTKLIADDAFNDNENLVDVLFPHSLRYIGAYAFSGCNNLTNVEFRDGLKCIDDGTFGGCYNLTEISLPDSLEQVGNVAFAYCDNLKNISMGKSLNLIGYNAFAWCPNIMKFSVNSSNKYFYTDSVGALFESNYIDYMGSGNRLIDFPAASYTESYTISKDVLYIDSQAFTGCSNLKQIQVENGNHNYIATGMALYYYDENMDEYSCSLSHLTTKNCRYVVPQTITINGTESPVFSVSCPITNNPENPTILDIPKNVDYVDSDVSPDYIFYEGTQEEWENGPGYQYDYYNDYLNYGRTTVIYEAYGKDLDEVIKEHPEIKTEDHEITITENDFSETGIIATTMNTTFNEPVQIAVNKAFMKAEQTQISAVVQDKDAVVYNIAIVNRNGGAITNLNGGTVTLKVPETLVGDNINDLNVYHITHDGKTELFSTKNNTISIEYIDGMKYFCFDITNWSPFIFEPIEKEPSPPEKLTVEFINDSISLDYKASDYLDVAYGPVHGDYTMKYESSNPKVASVDDNGKVTALKKGSATITCTVTDSNGNSVSDTCEVKVVYTWWQWLIKIVLFGWIWY